MPLPFLYPYDPLGNFPSNLIEAELHTVSAMTDPEQANFIVPRAAPYYLIGCVIRTGPLITDPALVEGTDYVHTHHFVEASQSLNKLVYGSITFLNRLYTGNVYITYQTLGGPYTLDDYSVVTDLTRSLYCIRVVTWAQIVGVPVSFPPVPHPHDTADLTGMADVVFALNALVVAIQGNTGNVNSIVATLAQHLTGGASHTNDQVGLGLVPNYAVATQDDVDGVATNKLMTPEMTYHAIQRFNTGGIALLDGSELIKGIVRLATSIQAANALTPRNDLAVSPESLWAALAEYSRQHEIGIGDLWFTTVVSRNPGTWLGYGTWVRVAQGRFPVGYNSADADFDAELETGGSKTHTLDKTELPAITLTTQLPVRTGGAGGPSTAGALTRSATDSGTADYESELLGDGTAMPILPPYIVFCFWQRTA